MQTKIPIEKNQKNNSQPEKTKKPEQQNPLKKMRKIPLRMCVGCMEMKPKKELVRVVKTKEGEISLDLTGKKSGRGAYVCNDKKCLQKARKTRRFEKAFSCKISDEVFEQMELEISDSE